MTATAPRLRAYVRRTILEKARDYAYPAKRRTRESTRSAAMDAMRGTNTGWWNDLIYTRDILDRFNRHRSEVAETIREFMGETGAEAWQNVHQGDDTSYADMLVACARRQTWEHYTGPGRRADEADAAARAVLRRRVSGGRSGARPGPGDLTMDDLEDIEFERTALRAERDEMLTVLRLAADFIEDEADNRGAAGSYYSDYEREPRDLADRIRTVIQKASSGA